MPSDFLIFLDLRLTKSVFVTILPSIFFTHIKVHGISRISVFHPHQPRLPREIMSQKIV